MRSLLSLCVLCLRRLALPTAAGGTDATEESRRVTGISGDLRQALYRLVWHALPQPRVALDESDLELHAFAVPDGVWWGRLRRRFGDSEFAARQTQRRPFFRSYRMQPRKSRCLVNLSGVRPSERLLNRG